MCVIKRQSSENENEIIKELNPVSVSDFFENLRKEVMNYYAN